jgi:trehalose 6-phosphate synthase/phosphatase
MDHEFGQVLVGGRPVKVDTFPLGVDLERFSKALELKEVKQRLEELKEETQGRKIILSVDRLDFTKGIPERLRAYELFLEKHPEWHDKVSMISLCVPSRTSVPEYRDLKREVDELVGRINGRFGSPGWTPIWYMYRFLTFERLVPLYQLADVALVTPLRDGMNLVAKEYLACHPEGAGVLVLSETAGAAEELGEALIVNPHDEGAIAAALHFPHPISGDHR